MVDDYELTHLFGNNHLKSVKLKIDDEIIEKQLDVEMSIYDFKRYVLLKTKNKPFFLKFNISNKEKLSKLLELNQNDTVEVFTDVNKFDLQVKHLRSDETYNLVGLQSMHTLDFACFRLRNLSEQLSKSDIFFILETGHQIYSEENKT